MSGKLMNIWRSGQKSGEAGEAGEALWGSMVRLYSDTCMNAGYKLQEICCKNLIK
jgi:hypothetical protein